ncbi:hypothetical protein GNF10_30125 [Nostoc sp. UCD121]|uniref:hypothetical protein n=1 Tax=unclassified Nostoc TaxID=2593658 RepID=UPI001623ADE1|nr:MULTISPECIES: hypothetical protein [unclassified Nostoc]MBC1220780.1 hypothetical protein [Nostoc sp. UCD120]MBC1280090.1 hypothetical protein [Nostoc sp. UCD121]MBC1299358.1 hypothetical protein [Nostoc sp. UCD122]
MIPTNLFTQSAGSGAAGDLTVTTKRLIVSDGGRLGSGTFGRGQGGVWGAKFLPHPPTPYTPPHPQTKVSGFLSAIQSRPEFESRIY